MATGEAHRLEDLRRAHVSGGKAYHEFLRRPSMSVGHYVLPAGGTDPQTPHQEDEVYVILRGRARIRVGGREEDVGPGSVVFVPAGLEHRFHDIEEELETFVVFAPPEGTGAPRAGRKA